MAKLLISCEGFDLGIFTIPKFKLYEGELITICLYGGPHFQDLLSKLIDIFTGKIKQDGVILNEPLTYAKPFKENGLIQLIFPTTIKRYIKSQNIKNPAVIKKIYEIESESFISEPATKVIRLEPTTKIVTLDRVEQKLLSLYSTFNRTNKIVFDLASQGPCGAIKIFQMVKSELGKTGAAVLLDGYEDEIIENESSKWSKVTIR